jgi:hypothetical protein
MMKRTVTIFGRAIPLWVVISALSVLVVAAGFFTWIQLGQFTSTLAPKAGPVVNDDVVTSSCTVIANPESFATTDCSITATLDSTDHQVSMVDVYPGVVVEIFLAVENLNTYGGGTVYGQITDISGLPAGIKYREDTGEPNRVCGQTLAPATPGWVFYEIEIEAAYDGSAFDVPLAWDFASPSCPASY